MSPPRGFKVIRDPLWNNIQVDAEALGALDTEPFQRLRYIRQLGHAFLVYPSATHTRFEHAVGAYHLARRARSILDDRGELDGIPSDESALIPLAALLHDIGHYPFSHALEEAGLPSHEGLAATHFRHPELHDALDRIPIAETPSRLLALIGGTSPSPLQGLISGSLDLDKIEYLTRDARMCGVPYGAVDVDRLLQALTVVDSGGRGAVAVREKGLSALESLVFARYQMYRNVYWHHAVRSATAMFKRAVRTAIAEHGLDPDWIGGCTDEVLMERLRGMPRPTIAHRLTRRRLYKRILDIGGDEVPEGAGGWVSDDPDVTARTEDRLAEELGMEAGAILLDFPAKAHMLEVDLPLLTRRGTVESLGAEIGRWSLGIQRVADELHARARRLRLFAADNVTIATGDLIGLIERKKNEVVGDLAAGKTLLPTV